VFARHNQRNAIVKRDHDFIRETLFTAEMWPKGYIGFTETLPFDDKPEKEREYLLKWEHHLRIMQDENLIFIRPIRKEDRHHKGEEYRLTSKGHDYLDAIRDDTVWAKLKAKFLAAGGVGLSVAIELAKEELARRILGGG
jgi:hypothetical protein